MRHLIVLFALLSTVVLGVGAAQAGAGGWDPDPKVQCENGADDTRYSAKLFAEQFKAARDP